VSAVLDRNEILAAMARAVASGDPDHSLARRLSAACVGIVGARGAAITLSSTTPERLTVWTSDGTSAQIEGLQDVLGEGPGQTAYDEGHAVVVELNGTDAGEFPVFSETARDLALRVTVWALPMRPEGETIGVMTLYSDRDSLDVDLADAQFVADAVGAALLDDVNPGTSLQHDAWSDRARVHQATGMVVAQLSVAPQDALAMLRAQAYSSNHTLDEVAADVVERRLVFTFTPEGVRHPGDPSDDTRSGGA
jgi:hypothetical protein